MSGRGRGGISTEFGLPLLGTPYGIQTIVGHLATVVTDAIGRLVVAGTRQGSLYTPEPIPSVPFYPQTGQGQVIAIGAVAVASAAMTLNREHCFWSEQNCWIRVAAGAAVLDFPFPAGAVWTYTPTAAGNQVISVIEMAPLGGNFYIGQSEAT